MLNTIIDFPALATLSSTASAADSSGAVFADILKLANGADAADVITSDSTHQHNMGNHSMGGMNSAPIIPGANTSAAALTLPLEIALTPFTHGAAIGLAFLKNPLTAVSDILYVHVKMMNEMLPPQQQAALSMNPVSLAVNLGIQSIQALAQKPQDPLGGIAKLLDGHNKCMIHYVMSGGAK